MKKQYFSEPYREYSDQDLLALLIGGEEHRANQIAYALLSRYGCLSALAQSDPHGILQIEGVGQAAAIRIHAGLRAGRRALFPAEQKRQIKDPDDAYARLWPMMESTPEETLWALYLNRNRNVIQQRKISSGNYAYTIVDPSQIYYHAVHCRASNVIISHNHPSGNSEPSSQDLTITERVAQAGQLLNIPLLDHLIIGQNNYCSLASCGILPSWDNTSPMLSSASTATVL